MCGPFLLLLSKEEKAAKEQRRGRPCKMRKHRKKNAFGIRYFQARKNTLLLSAFFLAGLTFGSFYAIADSSDSLVIVSIVINGIRAQSKASYLRLFYQAALPSAAVLIFLYFAANCCKGKLLVSMVPLVYGLSVGAIMTAVLCVAS